MDLNSRDSNFRKKRYFLNDFLVYGRYADSEKKHATPSAISLHLVTLFTRKIAMTTVFNVLFSFWLFLKVRSIAIWQCSQHSKKMFLTDVRASVQLISERASYFIIHVSKTDR